MSTMSVSMTERDEGSRRSHEMKEYKVTSVRHTVPPSNGSVDFIAQLAAGVRFAPPCFRRQVQIGGNEGQIAELLATEKFDRLVYDFLFPAPNIPDISRAVLFQHNVEAVIWKRHVEQAANPVARAIFPSRRGAWNATNAKCAAGRHTL